MGVVMVGKIQHYILSVLTSAIRRSGIPFYFPIASRPEQDTHLDFNAMSLHAELSWTTTTNPVFDVNIKVFLQTTSSHTMSIGVISSSVLAN
jgi:hypothetical protein